MSPAEQVKNIRISVLEIIDELQRVEVDREIGRPVSDDVDWVDCIQSAESLLREVYGELGTALEALDDYGDA